MSELDEVSTAAPAAPAGVPPAPAVRPRRSLSSRRRFGVVAGLVLAAVGFLLFQGLGNATVYFKTADEAVADRAELGGRRFRIEGLVVSGSLRPLGGDRVGFEVESAGVEVPVVHRGDPPELFREGIAVVLEGRWDDTTYASDRILVRHSSEYRAENPERMKDAAESGSP